MKTKVDSTKLVNTAVSSHVHSFFTKWTMGFCLFFVLNSVVADVDMDKKGIWISPSELRELPTVGRAWNRLKKAADSPAGVPSLRDQNQKNDVYVLAKAIVYARTGTERYRENVIEQLQQTIGTEEGGKTLSLGRNLVAYVIAADLVGLPPDFNRVFQAWLSQVSTTVLKSRTLRSTHEDRPNNWGTHAGASRAAIAVYLDDQNELEKISRVFKGYLGDRTTYAGFKYGDDLSWQCDSLRPVGINPKDCRKLGHPIGGILPDDQRRSGSFQWPPPKENYVYEGLQGAIVQAVILHRAGYNSFYWGDKALLRAYQWLHDQADFPPEGDDTWQLPLVDYFYGTHYWDGSPTRCGKNMCWTDWTHMKKTNVGNRVGYH
ncbi:MAG: alginate lyase family protein [Methylococcales bacterium]